MHDGKKIDWRWEDNDVSLENGYLVLRNTREPGTDGADGLVLAGGVDSHAKFETTYGYCETRVKAAPTRDGIHTAFWFLKYGESADNPGASDRTEIDIVESVHERDAYHFAVHWDGTKVSGDVGIARGIHDDTTHTFGLEWDSSSRTKWGSQRGAPAPPIGPGYSGLAMVGQRLQLDSKSAVYIPHGPVGVYGLTYRRLIRYEKVWRNLDAAVIENAAALAPADRRWAAADLPIRTRQQVEISEPLQGVDVAAGLAPAS